MLYAAWCGSLERPEFRSKKNLSRIHDWTLIGVLTATDQIMQLVIKQHLDAEAVHFYDSTTKDILYSRGNDFYIRHRNVNSHVRIPVRRHLRPFLWSRLARRALRLDMANMVLNHARSGVVILYRGIVYFYDFARAQLVRTGRLRQCRNVLHGGIAVTERGIYFGEYGQNPGRDSVPVWVSRDDGRSWRIVHEFAAGSIKHVHGVYPDPYSDRLWIPTGDFAGECFLFSTDEDFRELIAHGDGQQRWRPVSLLYTPESIFWGMDSQLETSHLCEFRRATGELVAHRAFPGPVWYSKQLQDGWSVLQTTVEIGPGVLDDHARLFMSQDLKGWSDVARFKKDSWSMRYFKFGVISFAAGPQTADEFVIFGEALEGLDGRARIVGLQRVAEPDERARVVAPARVAETA